MARGVTGGAAMPTVVYRVLPGSDNIEPLDWAKIFASQQVFVELDSGTSYQFLAYKSDNVRRNAPLDLLFILFEDKSAKVFFEFASAGEIEVCLYENPDVRRLGEAIPTHAIDRTSGLLPISWVYFQPVTLNLGIELVSHKSKSAFEWVLAPASMYLIRGINRSSRRDLSAVVLWEEIEVNNGNS